MPSEASRKKARETCDHDHNTVGCWTCGTLQPCKPCEAIAAALDEARAEGERIGEERAAATIRENVMSAKQAAERERWECYQLAETVTDDHRLPYVECPRCGSHIADAIAARGPMRGPEEDK